MPRPARRPLVLAAIGTLAIGLGVVAVARGWGVEARAAIIAATVVTLWLAELVPVWVPTVLLWIAVPLLLATSGAAFAPHRVVGWSIDPVLALFFGGFALAAAATRHGGGHAIAALALRLSRGRVPMLVALVAVATAFLSMWMSNIAAAALMLAALEPVLAAEPPDSPRRRALLLALALGADVGGIATPIGTGPNGIAIAMVERSVPLRFVDWMIFGVPLAAGLVLAAIALVLLLLRPTGSLALPAAGAPHATRGGTGRATVNGMEQGTRPRAVAIVFALTILLWLTEPLHGVRAWTIALAVPVVLLGTRLIGPRELRALDWNTLVLIAGGIGLGALLERSGLVGRMAGALPLDALSVTWRLFALALVCALLSALMSNTATATFFIPLAVVAAPSPSTAIIIAVAASLGIPFVVSTPPNAMAVGAGLPGRDLLVPGLLLMLGGCLLVALTGPAVLAWRGIP